MGPQTQQPITPQTPQTPQQSPGMQPPAAPQQSLDPQAVNLAKSIRQVESGGDFARKGKSGEFGAYQFLPGTWDSYAKEAGVSVPLEQATPEQQNEVAYKKIKGWKDQGYNVGQIASMWNAGEGKPNAYIEGNSGVNAQGVSYDTKAYAEKVAQNYQHLKGNQGEQSASQNAPADNKGGGLLSAAGSLANFAFPILGDIGADVQGKADKSALQQAGDALLSGSWFIPGIGEAAEAGLRGAKAAGSVSDMLAANAAGKTLPGLADRLAPQAGKIPALAKMAASGAATGYASDVGSKLAAGQSPEQAAVPGMGTITGAGLGGLGGALSPLLDNLPNRITRGALKLDPATAQYALDSKPMGTVKTLLNESFNAQKGYGQQIKGILSNPDYATHMGNGNAVIKEIQDAFPNAKYKSADIQRVLQRLVPTEKGLVAKVASGRATLLEKNELRSALDEQTGRFYRGVQAPTAEQQKVGKTAADALRREVQTVAPETASVFRQRHLEANLNTALKKLDKKTPGNLIGLRDLFSVLAGGGIGSAVGGLGGGPVGSIAGLALEKLASSPSGQFGLAKALQKSVPAIKKGGLISQLLLTRQSSQPSGQ